MEKLLQFVGASDDDANAQNVQLEKQSKCSEVSIEEGVFVIPFCFYRDPLLEVVNVMGRCQCLGSVGRDFDIETLFQPTSNVKKCVDCTRYRGFIPTFFRDVAAAKLELSKNVY